MFRHRQPLRRWVARVLLLWLLGVAVGLAQACLAPTVVGLPEAVAGSSAGVQVSHHAADAVVDALHHQAHAGPTAHSPDPQGPSAQLNCQDFCDKASVSMPQQKSALDDVQGQALAPRVRAAGLAAPAFLTLSPGVPRRDGVWAPPIPIAFLRLTL